MTAPRITPKRLDLLANIGNVSRWPGGDRKRYVLGRWWTVNADVDWLVDAGLVELNPDDADLDVQGYRPTAAAAHYLTADELEDRTGQDAQTSERN